MSDPIKFFEKINFISGRKADNKLWIMGLFLIVAVCMWSGIIFFGSSTKYADEDDHSRQIFRFMKGNYAMLSSITTIPGYHVTVATIAKIIGSSRNSQHIRLITLGLSMVSIRIFYLLAKKIKEEDAFLKTLQYIFFPVSFIYFPLIYTDIFSLLLVLAAFYSGISRKYSISAIFALFSLLVRQTNIVWVIFFLAYFYFLENDFSFSLQKMQAYGRKVLGYLGLIVLFVVFVLLNKGVAIGDRAMQQAGFYMGNVYFFMALVGFLFAPITVYSILKGKLFSLKKRIVYGAGAGLFFALLFVFFQPALHGYNLKTQFLRNIILALAYGRYVWVYALAIMFGCLTLSLLELEKKSAMILLFILVSLVPSMLIEQRYSIVPLVFILLLRKKTSPGIEYANVFHFFALSLGLFFMLLKTGLFL